MNTGKVLLSMLAGISAGAILGILYAPEKGSFTRKQISNKSDDYLNNLGEKFDNFVDSMSNQVSKMKSEATGMASNGKAKFEEAEGGIFGSQVH